MAIPFRRYWTLQKKYMLPYRRKIIGLALLMVCDVALRVVNPQIVRFYIDIVTTSTGGTLYIEAAFLYIAIATFQQVALVLGVYVAQDLAWSSTNSLRNDLFRHSLQLDMTFHNEYRPGDMIERIDGDINTLSEFFSRFTIVVLTNALIIVGILVALFFVDVTIGLVFSLFVLLATAVLYRVRDVAMSLWREVRESTMLMLGTIEETLSGTEDVRGNGAILNEMRKYSDRSKTVYDKQIRASVKTTYFIGAIYGMEALIITLVFGVGVPFLDAGAISLGTIVMIYLYAGLILFPIIRMLRQFQELQLAGASIERVEKLFATESKLVDSGTKRLPAGPLALEFDRISFEYETDTPVLKDLSFNLVKGRVLGLIGPTGSGKSTVSRLIFRLYDPGQGTVRLDSQDIQNLPLSVLRGSVAMVTQSVELFHASLRDNITFFNQGISDERILRVIEDVGLETWFESLPDGLDTEMRSDSGLSAGESQMLALTRVFLKDPGLIILDEASSRLDPATERMIDRAIARLLEGRTAIVIAHRLSTLNRADDIMLIEDGAVTEFGERQELANDPSSRYHELLRKGMLEVLV